MSHESSTPPSHALNEGALELAARLRQAFEAWAHQDAPAEEEVIIATELMLKGVFGFIVPMLVNNFSLQERGAQTVTHLFAQALAAAIQERRRGGLRVTAEQVVAAVRIGEEGQETSPFNVEVGQRH